MTDIPPIKSAALGLYLVARKVLLITDPVGDDTLSWRAGDI